MLKAVLRIARTSVQAARIDEQKFYAQLIKALKGTGMIQKIDQYKRARGLAIGVVLKPKVKIDRVLAKLGWKATGQGTYSRKGEWPLFVGQAGANAYAIQLMNAGESQSMHIVGDRIHKQLPFFHLKTYDSNALLIGLSDSVLELDKPIKEARDFLESQQFKQKSQTQWESQEEGLGCDVKIVASESKAPQIVLNFYFVGIA